MLRRHKCGQVCVRELHWLGGGLRVVIVLEEGEAVETDWYVLDGL